MFGFGDRFKAFSVHLAISLCVIASFLALVLFVWYTPPILRLEGGDEVMLILFAVDLVLGPIMTFVLYRKGKPGLVFDLSVVVVVQLMAFSYGAWTLYSQRPLFLTFTKDRFEIMAASVIDSRQLEESSLKPGILSRPQPVFVKVPDDRATREKIMFEALGGGRDYNAYPEFYRPLGGHLAEMAERSWPPARLRDHGREDAARNVEKWLEDHGRRAEQVMILPIVGYARDGLVVLDRESGAILGYLFTSIW